MCWRHTSAAAASPPRASKPLPSMHVWAKEVAAARRSKTRASFEASLRASAARLCRHWQAPPQLLALLAGAAALRGERACLCRHEVASIASISAAADLGSSAAACFADMWRIAAARFASASHPNRLCKV
jgi:hypothetical protein